MKIHKRKLWSTWKSCAFFHPNPWLAFKSSSCAFTTYHLKAHLSRKHLIKTTQTVLWGRWSLTMHVDARSNTQFLLNKHALIARAEMDTEKITELSEARTATSCKTTSIRVDSKVHYLTVHILDLYRNVFIFVSVYTHIKEYGPMMDLCQIDTSCDLNL